MNKLKLPLTIIVSVLVVVGLSSASVSAANMPKASEMNSNSCPTSMKPFENSSISNYGNKRVVTRQGAIKTERSLIMTAQANVRTYNSKKIDVQTTLNKIAGIEKNIVDKLSETPVSPAYSIPAPQTNLTQTLADYENAKAVIANSDRVLSSSKSSRGQIINATCAAIFDARVFSVVMPEARAQYILSRIDNIGLSNSINSALYQATKNVYTAKLQDTEFASDQALDTQTKALSDPQANFDSLNASANLALQNGYGNLTCTIAGKSTVGFRCLDDQLTKLKSTILTQSRESQAAFKAVTGKKVNLVAIKAKIQAAAKAKTNKPLECNSPGRPINTGSTGGAIYTEPGVLC